MGPFGDIILHIPNCHGNSVLTILRDIFIPKAACESAVVVHRNRLTAMVKEFAEARRQPTEGAAEATSESHMRPTACNRLPLSQRW